MLLVCNMRSINTNMMINRTRYSICNTPVQGRELTACRWERQHLLSVYHSHWAFVNFAYSFMILL